MSKKLIITLAAVIGILTTLIVPTTASADPAIHDVWPGQSIQDAVKAANLGDTILVHAGTYHQSVFIPKPGITLQGESGTILDGNYPSDPDTFLGTAAIILSGSGITVEGLTIKHFNKEEPGDLKPKLGTGISLMPSATDCYIRNNHIKIGLIGIKIGGQNNRVESNYMKGMLVSSISIVPSANGNLVQYNIGQHANTGAGIQVMGSGGNQILENEISGTAINGIALVDCPSNIVNNNHVSDSGHNGIMLLNANNNAVEGNHISNSGFNGIAVQDGAADNVVTGNHVTNSGIEDGGGIMLQNADDNLVSDNQVTYSTGPGISIEGTGNRVLANRITDIQNQGIAVFTIAEGNVVYDNRISSTQTGIGVGGSNNEIVENKVTGSASDGITIFPSASNNLVLGNKVTGSGEGGIVMHSSSFNEIADNHVTVSGLDGIVMIGASSGNYVRDNYVSDSNENGIAAIKGASGNEIRENHVMKSAIFDLFDENYPPLVTNLWQNNKYETSNFPIP
ncbi:MAG: right-handed parallel beta-helix repeat-containing protein [Dehalococcoidales bacterium]|nr:MAG: right-handed parallel beta-helix repeat-containing protein [Dehalococcoidales bacterium]